MDPRPLCRFCGQRWTPPPGVDSNVHFCSGCSQERRDHAAKIFDADGKVSVEQGGYTLRVPKDPPV